VREELLAVSFLPSVSQERCLCTFVAFVVSGLSHSLTTEGTKVHEGVAGQKVKPGGLARLFSFITLWGLTWF
jgi:hypothetical protein